eukprot:PITA_10001
MVVQIRYTTKLQDGRIFEKKGYEGYEPFQFVVDEGQVIAGLDKAVETMKTGEIALITIGTEYEKIEASKHKKEQGNSLFKVGKYERAAKKYEKAEKYIEHDSSSSTAEKTQSKVLKVLCNLNLAACCLKLKDFKKAVKLCSKVLEFES